MTQEYGFGYGPDGHLTVEVVSDLVEGLLNEDQQSSVERHLNRCASCHEIAAALQQVQELLRTAEPVGPMPMAVARRIDEALAREAAARSPAATRSASPAAVRAPDGPAAWGAGPSPYGAEQGAGTVASLADARARRNRRRGRLVSIAAGVAVLAVGGAVAAVSLSGGSGPTTPNAGTVPGNASHLQVRYSTDSGTAYTQNDLDGQVHALLAADGVPGWNAPAGEALSSPLPAAPSRPGCVDAGIDRAAQVIGTDPLAVDKGTVDGAPVWVVVLPDKGTDPTDPASVAVFVLDGDPDCPASPPKVKDRRDEITR